jgi:hypothetical protein
MKFLATACLCFFASLALAATNDDLWEVTTQMNIPGMPAGMGAQKHQVCSEKGDPKKAMTREDSKCKVTDYKETGTRVQMTVQCPDGVGTLDNTFNAARTEYKGTMKMKSKEGDMTMNMQGRRIGSCDAAVANKPQTDPKMAALMQQSNAAVAKMDQEQLAGCAKALDTMQVQQFGIYAYCNEQAGQCESMVKNEGTKRSGTACMANVAEYCKRYQTKDGFLKANANPQSEKTCKVSNTQLKSGFCASAAKSEDLVFLGKMCPVEAKPVAQAHCTGRGYTSQIRDKYTDFCKEYLSHATLEQPAPTAADIAKDPAKAVTEGVTQGINKLKGLFGR